MKLEFYNPSGDMEVLHPHATRLPSLKNARVGFLSNGQWQAFRSLPLIKSLLEKQYSDVDILPLDTFPEGTEVIGSESTIDLIQESGVDAVIIGNAACGACSTACGVAAAQLESRGIPTVTITREDFVGVMRNAVAGKGLLPDIAMVTFPMEIFLPDSDLAPVSERCNEISEALTSWTPRLSNQSNEKMVTVEGNDFQEALYKANNLFLINGWGDGLPLWPASRERVDSMLTGTDLPRIHVLGRFPPRGAIATVETCAVALAMVGGRPEYLPVLIAAVEALLDPLANSEQMQATSAATFPVIIVNGPISKEIRLNSGFGCLGPDAQHPAGGCIGRALRQMQQNLGGALPGVGTMAPWGAMRYTNVVFAEDEDGLPAGWLPHGTERHGYPVGTNSLSFFWGTGATNIKRRGAMKESLEEDVVQGLHRIAGFLAAPHLHYTTGYDDGTPGALLLTRVVADYLASSGWTKEKTRQFLWEHSAISHEMLRRSGGFSWIDIAQSKTARENAKIDPWPITAKPENLILTVAGGGHPTHAFWLQSFSQNVVGRQINVPSNFDSLLLKADLELGCAADVCMM